LQLKSIDILILQHNLGDNKFEDDSKAEQL